MEKNRMENICWNAQSKTIFEIVKSHNPIFTQKHLCNIFLQLCILFREKHCTRLYYVQFILYQTITPPILDYNTNMFQKRHPPMKVTNVG